MVQNKVTTKGTNICVELQNKHNHVHIFANKKQSPTTQAAPNQQFDKVRIEYSENQNESAITVHTFENNGKITAIIDIPKKLPITVQF